VRGLAILLGALILAGCGGSTSASTSSSSTASPTTPPLSTTAPTTGPETTVTLTKTAPTPTTTGAINVRVPARFTILASGSVSPPTIAIPAHLPVELIVVGDAHAHRIALRTTTFTIGAHEQAEKLIDGLRTGSYPLKVDGAPKAVLTIGANPGP
jgi:hypothetical protein